MPIIDRMKSAVRRDRLSAVRWLAIVEMALLAVLAVQAARLVWAVATPIGAFGDWRGRQATIPSPAARQALFAAFDPFFRTSAPAGGGGVVTSLSLSLFGVRVNEGSGQGSAIIATPDGVQGSYAVGDEIMPGVLLKSVEFDHVVIDRGGAQETLFLDQSTPAPAAATGGAPSAAPPVQQGGPAVSPSTAGNDLPPERPVRTDPTVAQVKSDIGFQPRSQSGRVTGLVVSAKGPAFRAAGFQDGDVIREVNGRPIGSMADLQALQSQLALGARLSLSVERGAAVVPIALTIQGQ